MPDASPSHRDDVAGLGHDLRIACMRVSRRVRFDSPSQVAPHQFSVLARLQQRSRSLGELAECERVTPPSMSRTVNGLVERALVQRAADPDDGRAVVLSLTPEGQSLILAERERRDAWMAARLEALTDGEREVLARATVILEQVAAQ